MTSTSMPPLAPTLPLEVVLMITRLAARSSTHAALTLALISRAVGQAAQEELQRVVVLTYFSRTIEYSQLLRDARGSRLAPKVSALALPRHHEDFLEYYDAILQQCTRLTSLLIAGPLLGILSLPLSLAEMVVHGSIVCSPQSPITYDACPFLQRVCLFHTVPERELLSSLACLPHLTHLALSFDEDRLDYHNDRDNAKLVAQELTGVLQTDRFQLLLFFGNGRTWFRERLQKEMDSLRDGSCDRIRRIDRCPSIEDWMDTGRMNWAIPSQPFWDTEAAVDLNTD